LEDKLLKIINKENNEIVYEKYFKTKNNNEIKVKKL